MASEGPTNPKAVQERAAVKAAVKREYQKQVLNPYRHASGEGGVLFDPAVQRFMSMRATPFDHFKPTPKTTFYGMALILLPIAGYAWWMTSSRAKFEEQCRTGQIAYADRKFKFA